MVSLSGSARSGPLSNCGTLRCATAPNGEHRSTSRRRGNRRGTKGWTDGSPAKARRQSPEAGTGNIAAKLTWRSCCGGCSGSELKRWRRSRCRRQAESEPNLYSTQHDLIKQRIGLGFALYCKKSFSIFPPPARMSLTKLSLGRIIYI
jgi:hypothetical protein